MPDQKAIVDSEGRLNLPERLRRDAGIEPGMIFEIRVREGRIEAEPVPQAVRVEWIDGWLTAVSDLDAERLSQETTDQILQAVRERRDA